MGEARRSALRRYPALAFLAVAGALALLLPSSLRVPLAGPPSVAELAPVPAKDDGGAAGDLSELGQAGSGGLGSGSARAGAGGTTSVPAATDGGLPGQRRPSGKRCVGSPPRQTEDPLSPPCVAYFDGDNGGATTRGVTGDEVRVVLHLGATSDHRFIDYEDPKDANESPEQAQRLGAVVRGLQRYFNERFQTYGRRVHFFGYSGPGTDSQPEQLRAQVEAIDRRWRPFAIVPVGSFSSTTIVKEAAARDIVVVSHGGFDRGDQQRVAPYLLTYTPDLQDQAAIAASYVCRTLARRPARWSGNVTDRTRERVFGLLYQISPQVPEHERRKELFKDEARRQCGLTGMREAGARTSNAGQGDYTTNIADFRQAGVTTVLFFSSITGPGAWGRSAEAAKWYPEWVVTGSNEGSGIDTNPQGRLVPPLVWANAFGFTFDIRRGPLQEQRWFQAVQEGCGGCTWTADVRPSRLYSQLLLLFWGIQAAGPRLTPHSMDRGLHAIPPRRAPDPDTPAAYFTPGNWSWVKDAAAIWWDGTRTEPGGSQPGCYRLVARADRFRAGEWPEGDAHVKDPDAACQGPTQ